MILFLHAIKPKGDLLILLEADTCWRIRTAVVNQCITVSSSFLPSFLPFSFFLFSLSLSFFFNLNFLLWKSNFWCCYFYLFFSQTEHTLEISGILIKLNFHFTHSFRYKPEEEICAWWPMPVYAIEVVKLSVHNQYFWPLTLLITQTNSTLMNAVLYKLFVFYTRIFTWYLY